MQLYVRRRFFLIGSPINIWVKVGELSKYKTDIRSAISCRSRQSRSCSALLQDQRRHCLTRGNCDNARKLSNKSRAAGDKCFLRAHKTPASDYGTVDTMWRGAPQPVVGVDTFKARKSPDRNRPHDDFYLLPTTRQVTHQRQRLLNNRFRYDITARRRRRPAQEAVEGKELTAWR